MLIIQLWSSAKYLYSERCAAAQRSTQWLMTCVGPYSKIDARVIGIMTPAQDSKLSCFVNQFSESRNRNHWRGITWGVLVYGGHLSSGRPQGFQEVIGLQDAHQNRCPYQLGCQSPTTIMILHNVLEGTSRCHAVSEIAAFEPRGKCNGAWHTAGSLYQDRKNRYR